MVVVAVVPIVEVAVLVAVVVTDAGVMQVEVVEVALILELE